VRCTTTATPTTVAGSIAAPTGAIPVMLPAQQTTTTTTHTEPVFGHKLADAQAAVQQAKADTKFARATGATPAAVVLSTNVPYQ